ncbi:hypothetical protein Tco_0471591 [Tanacetum coccineum]
MWFSESRSGDGTILETHGGNSTMEDKRDMANGNKEVYSCGGVDACLNFGDEGGIWDWYSDTGEGGMGVDASGVG